LRTNLVKNAAKRHWTVRPEALFESTGTARLHSEFEEAGSGHHHVCTDGGREIVVRTGDAMVRAGLPVPDALKIDVQGAELPVLRGMTGLLDQVAVLFVELHDSAADRYGTTPADVERFLRARGFTIEDLGEPATRRTGVRFLYAMS